jgi:uncharacterized coiled-coil protein SlyX
MKLEIDLSDVNVHIHLDQREAPRWAKTLHDMVSRVLANQETMMSTLEELNAVLAEISTEMDKVSADTDNLLAQLANIPPGGLTPEQQASIDAAVVSATAISTRLKALDAKVPDVTPPV